MKGSDFSSFTNQYSLSKTLRFELRPVYETKKMLEQNNIFIIDQKRKEAYEKTKPFFDRLHYEFISESLQDKKLKYLDKYEGAYFAWKADSKNKELKKKLESVEKDIREEIASLFNETATTWVQKFSNDVDENASKKSKLKKGNKDFLFESAIFSVLKKKYNDYPDSIIKVKDEADKSIFDGWDKWSGYFKKFFETRKNFYKADGTATAIATRIVNDNLRRFCDNISLFERVIKDVDLSDLEKEQRLDLKEVFSLEAYSNYLNQDGINQYNKVIGGDGQNIKGINQRVNEYRQKTKEKLPRLKKLNKQIGSDKEVLVDIIEDDNQLREVLIDFVDNVKDKIEIFNTCNEYLLSEDEKNLSGIYFRKEAVNTIVRRWFADSEKISSALVEVMKNNGDKTAKFDPKIEEYKFPDFISWQAIKSAAEKVASDGAEESKGEDASEQIRLWKGLYYETLPDLAFKAPWQQFLAIFGYEYRDLLANGHSKAGKDWEELTKDIEGLLREEKLQVKESITETVKAFSDRALYIYQFAKYFALEKSRQWNPEGLEVDDFYTLYDEFYSDSYETVVKAYNKIRNYMTKKPFNQDKWVLKFENSALAGPWGWDKNKESTNGSIVLRRSNKYYLAVMDNKHKTIFDNIPENERTIGYEKMVYKYVKDVVTGIPKSSTQVKQVIEHFRNSSETYVLSKTTVGDFIKPLNITKEVFDLNNKVYLKTDLSKSEYRWNIKDKNVESNYIKSFQKEFLKLGGNKTKYEESVKLWINFCLEFLSSYPSSIFFDYSKLKTSEEYATVDEAYSDMNDAGYVVFFEKISEHYIEKLNQEGKLYLFEIHNKDWNLKDGKSKVGSKNLHTLYFEQLFSKENQESNFTLKLNGEAELFFRPATPVVKLGKVKDKNGKEVVKNKRYAKDKILFHVPITFNRTAHDAYGFNKTINEFLANNPDINIIGIDRGEKHLAYLSVINQRGEILEIKSLNEVKGVKYADLLEARARDRESARRDWKSIEQIKDLKKGYISNVVREVADLIIKHSAIVVFEDLNMRFKQVRGGIEKSVYQQLEKALIDKLNFLVDKNEMDPTKAGHILNAFQLTEKFESFQKIGKQTGVLFYTQAEYTSQTDPVTGFRKNLYISNSATIEKIKEVIHKFDKIGWDDTKESYFFDYNPINFVEKKFKENTYPIPCKVYANVPRIKRERQNNGYWEAIAVNPNDKFAELFMLWEFDNPKGDILGQIVKLDKEGRLNGRKYFDRKERNFWQSFVYLLNLVLQLRNTTATQYRRDESGKVIEVIEGVDFISSPVEPFFCTDGGKYTEGFVNLAGLERKVIGEDNLRDRFNKEFNGDANGAFNIARKGIIILRHISDNPDNPDLFIPRVEWDKFVQEQWRESEENRG